MQSASFRSTVDALAGYEGAQSGLIVSFEDAFAKSVGA
jgi:hypothetical protein